MLLYAGTTALSFKYSHLAGAAVAADAEIYLIQNNIMKVIVTKLKQSSQSAGNFIKFNTYTPIPFPHTPNGSGESLTPPVLSTDEGGFDESSSETLRNKSVIKKISVHVPTHLRPENDSDFGHYLAGLIDGVGHFSKIPQLVIVFNEVDAFLAYYIKTKLGFGKVYKVKNKNAVILVVSKPAGLIKILNLINGKIRSQNKFDQIKKNILSNPKFKFVSISTERSERSPLHLKPSTPILGSGKDQTTRSLGESTATSAFFTINSDTDLNNHWLSGFSDADASFQIKIINSNNETGRFEIGLNFKIDQKKEDLLILIKNFLGGNIGYIKSQDTYYFDSTSFGSAKKIVSYFDKFHLLSSKHINFLKWRKAYILIQNKEHLNSSGLEKITKIKQSMNYQSSALTLLPQDYHYPT